MNQHEEEEYGVDGYDFQMYQEQPLYEDEAGAYEEGGESEEDFPEPGKAGGKKFGMSKPMMIGAGVLGAIALSLGGVYMMAPEMLDSMNPATLMASVTGDAPPAEEEAPPPRAHAKPHAARKPHPAAVAAKPIDDGWTKPTTAVPPKPKPKPVAAVAAEPPKPKPVAAKPHHKPAAVAPVVAEPVLADESTGGGAASARTNVTFASGSYWVAAAEMEKLWAFSNGLKSTGGQITVESWVGTEADGVQLSRKRASRVAELLTKNNPSARFKVNVKVHGTPSQWASRRVDVIYSSKL